MRNEIVALIKDVQRSGLRALLREERRPFPQGLRVARQPQCGRLCQGAGKITTTVEEYGEYRSTIKKRCATLEEEYGAFLQKKRARLNSSKAAQGGNGIRGMFSAMRAAAAAEGGGAAAAAAAAADDQEA